MAPFIPDESMFSKIKGSVVVLTGGASGMGAELVRRLNAEGAHVAFGDVSEKVGTDLAKALDQPDARVIFEGMNTSIYADVVRLFRKAREELGHIDHGIACAAVLGEPQLYTPDLTPANIDAEPDVRPLDVNLKGSVYFARVALAFLNESKADEKNKSLTLIASDMPFIGMSVSTLYQASKAGVLQLMRTLRPLLPNQSEAPVRINAICPNVTVTPMVEGWLTETWKKENLALNTPEEIAKIMLGILSHQEIKTQGKDKQLHGMAFDIVSGEAWEFEEEFDSKIASWLGSKGWYAIVAIRQLFHRMNMPIWGSVENV